MWISRSQFRAKVISQNLYFIPCLSFSFESLGIPPKVPTCSYNSLIVSSYSAALMFTSFNFSSCLKTQLPLPFLTFIHINKILDDSFVDSFLPVQSWCVDVHGSFIAKTAITNWLANSYFSSMISVCIYFGILFWNRDLFSFYRESVAQCWCPWCTCKSEL